MGIIGKKVSHGRYGEGIIERQYDNKLEVLFGTMKKCFLFPDSFEQFLTPMDAETDGVVNKELEIMQEERRRKESERKLLAYQNTVKNKRGSHGVFDMRKEDLDLFVETGELSTGRTRKAATEKGVVIPAKLDMDSACILTTKEKGEKESERKIVGLLMTASDFVGEKCLNGMVSVHENYRIMLRTDESVYFWNMFEEKNRKESWGSRKMKYLPLATVKEIINRIFVSVSDEEILKKKMIEFDQYFCDMNAI